MKLISACSLLLAAAIALTAPALAGNTGMVRGTAVLEPFATECCYLERLAQVTVRIIGPSEDLTVTTNNDGRFVFLEVSPGTYRIFIDDNRYYSFCERVTVTADQTTSADVFVGPRNGFYSESCNQPLNLVRPGVSADVYDIF